MGKEVLESSIDALDKWAITFAFVVAVGVAGEFVVGYLHWTKSRRLRAAEAEENLSLRRDIAEANRRRVQLEARMAPRMLTSDQREALSMTLGRFAGHKLAVVSVNETEALEIVGGLQAALGSAKWLVYQGSQDSARSVVGMLVEVGVGAGDDEKRAAQALADALRDEKLAVEGPVQAPWAPSVISPLNVSATIKLTIGSK